MKTFNKLKIPNIDIPKYQLALCGIANERANELGAGCANIACNECLFDIDKKQEFKTYLAHLKITSE